jgi:hypothetical protein
VVWVNLAVLVMAFVLWLSLWFEDVSGSDSRASHGKITGLNMVI